MTDTDKNIVESKPRSEDRWTVRDASELYGIDAWSAGYVRVGDNGRLRVHPRRDPKKWIDLASLVDGLADRGFSTPALLRFSDLLEDRLSSLCGAFDTAIRDQDYRGSYTALYPIKVNQQRQVCEEIIRAASEGDSLPIGLECGSKPELIAVLGLTSEIGGTALSLPIVCNGFKDEEYCETVVLAHKLGRDITPIVEQQRELDLILRAAKTHGVRPQIGLRIKPAATGAGRWERSGGLRAKFGLTASGVLDAYQRLADEGMGDCLQLLHFHVGSQLSDIRMLNEGVAELAHIYCELSRLGAGLSKIDVGGGLGVDYDGSRSTGEGSVNYTLSEYAADVVHRIRSVCDDAGVEHPAILTESGRAMVAYSSVLVMDVPGAMRFEDDPKLDLIRALVESQDDVPQPVLDLIETYESLDTLDPNEAQHDATHARREAMTLFRMGYLSLPLRAAAERLFAAIGRRVIERCRAQPNLVRSEEEIDQLDDLLSDVYFTNFSVFQSLPDAWAIEQVFPIVPIQRLDERPTRRAVLADITCDSDGEVHRFSNPAETSHATRLPVHELRKTPDGSPEPYYLGVFLVGAYQEVLGDLHNLFGDTHAVHVAYDDDAPDGWRLVEVVEGDSVREVLGYVQFHPEALLRAMRNEVEVSTRAGRLSVSEGREFMRRYGDGLEGYTYLE